MHPFPHLYSVTAAAAQAGDVRLEGSRLPPLRSASPAEFDGPGDQWSPETLLVAAVADCFILTFRAIAGASKLPWINLSCRADGTLERVDRVTAFTSFRLRAELQVPDGANVDQARRLLAKAEEVCLVTRSMKAETHLEAAVMVISGVGAG